MPCTHEPRPTEFGDEGEFAHLNFGFTEARQGLREYARKFLDEQCPMSEIPIHITLGKREDIANARPRMPLAVKALSR